MKYTVKLHRGRVKAMLRLYKKHPREIFCPGQKKLLAASGFKPFVLKDVCDTCKRFIGLDHPWHHCPCGHLGDEEAFRTTYEALADWQVGSHPMSENPKPRPQAPKVKGWENYSG